MPPRLPLVFLLVSHPVWTHAEVSASRTTTRPPAKLQQTQMKTEMNTENALRVANTEAEKAGYQLKDYKAPKVVRSPNEKTWLIFYVGKIPAPGHHFLVRIDAETGKADVLRGE